MCRRIKDHSPGRGSTPPPAPQVQPALDFFASAGLESDAFVLATFPMLEPPMPKRDAAVSNPNRLIAVEVAEVLETEIARDKAAVSLFLMRVESQHAGPPTVPDYTVFRVKPGEVCFGFRSGFRLLLFGFRPGALDLLPQPVAACQIFARTALRMLAHERLQIGRCHAGANSGVHGPLKLR
jgi:hypothetical protein